jgi:hypothetical protein
LTEEYEEFALTASGRGHRIQHLNVHAYPLYQKWKLLLFFLVLCGRSDRETPKIGHVRGSQECESEIQELRHVISSSRKHFPTLGAFLLQLDEEIVSPVMSVRLSLLVWQRDFLLSYFVIFMLVIFIPVCWCIAVLFILVIRKNQIFTRPTLVLVLRHLALTGLYN